MPRTDDTRKARDPKRSRAARAATLARKQQRAAKRAQHDTTPRR